ncbi:hypothetical protein HU200_004898 [Digitaria exilis]|uniref:Transcription repressor n=1 Tax=Digitaria exilis TaxID=1010633 RepID=A0A835FUS6_9POAL|nr:hypothetical protein HU200_004898 [Digitaria exilis]
MGRHKFRLSDMIPNAWFFKLRDMRPRGAGAAAPSPRAAAASRPLPSTPRHAGGEWLPHRASHYYTPRAGDDHLVLGSPPPLHHPSKLFDTSRFPPLQLPSPPRRSSSRRRHHRRRRSVKLALSSVSSSSGVASSPASAVGCRCGRRPDLVVVGAEAPDTPPPCRRDMFVGYSSDDEDDEDADDDLKKPTLAVRRGDDKLDGKVFTSATEIIIDLRTKKKKRPPEKTLPPIITKTTPARRRDPDAGCELEDKHIDVLKHATTHRDTPAHPEQSKQLIKPRRSVSSPRRLKTRANTPRVAAAPANKCKPPATAAAARSPGRATTKPPPPLAESFAVVKTSRDPRRDFRESMEEMITENGIRTAADLEDLLACYLALNAAEYHDLIVEVFEHIWVTLLDVKM